MKIEDKDPDAIKQNLRKSFEEICRFDIKWETENAEEIRKWAGKNKGASLNICEALAVLNRTNELVTGGHRLRLTQLISVLMFLHSPGKLCEIQAGEGKTTIVALLAAIKILQGEFPFVDVITSNQVLAAEGAADKTLFYNLLGITVATNNVDKEAAKPTNEGRPCYLAQVVYGAIGTFQFDYLRETFECQQVRNGRTFGYVILDEVDSMLIDGGGHLVKISVPLPGMESLKYYYIPIWISLGEVEMELTKEIRQKMEQKKQELANDKSGMTDEEKQEEFEHFQAELMTSITNDGMRERVLAKNPLDVNPMVPQHLTEFSKNSLTRWINSAMHAKHGCHENRDYVIKVKTGSAEKDENLSEKVIVPVDYSNTGVTLKDTIWSHGLHQFVQLKHNLRLTSESLTSSCISNYGYIKLYPKLYGMTGTLGSKPEQELLARMYDVSFAIIPPFKTKRFEELPGIVSEDQFWRTEVALETLLQVKGGRGVLIISQTIEDSLTILKGLKNIQNVLKVNDKLWPELNGVETNIRIFHDEEDSKVLQCDVGPGDVIAATNIAGRGADFKTTSQLEKNGGLHVILSFYPDNQRVRDQAFYRTSRQGSPGSARIIMKESEVVALGIDMKSMNMEDDELMLLISKTKALNEKNRVDKLKSVKVAELYFQDQLFLQFAKLCVAKEKDLNAYVLKDLKEYWAFWLEKQDFSETGTDTSQDLQKIQNSQDSQKSDSKQLESRLDKKAENIFSTFEKTEIAQTILTRNVVSWNPYYAVQQGEHFLRNHKWDEGKLACKRALEISEKFSILYSAYIKLFEISVEQGNVLLQKFYDALAKVAVFGHFVNVKSTPYRDESMGYLEKARKALDCEITFIEKELFPEKKLEIKNSEDSQLLAIEDTVPAELEGVANQSVTAGDSRGGNQNSNGGNQNSNSGNQGTPGAGSQVSKIENENVTVGSSEPKSDENLFAQHLQSRLVALKVHHQHVGQLYDQLKDADTSKQYTIGSRITHYLTTLEDETQLKNAIFPSELSELNQIGLHTMYGLREVHDAPSQIIASAQGQIVAGLGFCAIGLFPVGGTLISEGILDIAMELINYKRSTGFDLASYCKSKAISYGISLLTMGLSAILSSTRIMQKAANACKSIAKLLRESKRMRQLCEFIAKVFDKLVIVFQKLVQLSLQVGQQVSKFTSVLRTVGKTVMLGVTGAVIMERVVTAGLEKVLQLLKPYIEKEVKKSLVNDERFSCGYVRQALQYTERSEVLQIATKVMEDDPGLKNWLTSVTKEIALGMARQSNNWKVKAASLAVDGVSSVDKALGYSTKFKEAFILSLLDSQSEGVESKTLCQDDKQVTMMLGELSGVVANQIYSMIIQFLGKFVNTTIVTPLLNSVFAKAFAGKVKSSKEKQIVKRSNTVSEDPTTDSKAKADALASEILGVNPGETDENVLKVAHRKKLVETHPDKNKDDQQNACRKFNEVGRSWDYINGKITSEQFLRNIESGAQSFQSSNAGPSTNSKSQPTAPPPPSAGPSGPSATPKSKPEQSVPKPSANNNVGPSSNILKSAPISEDEFSTWKVSKPSTPYPEHITKLLKLQSELRIKPSPSKTELPKLSTSNSELPKPQKIQLAPPVPVRPLSIRFLQDLKIGFPFDCNNCVTVNLATRFFGVSPTQLLLATNVLNSGEGATKSDIELMFQRLELETISTQLSGSLNERAIKNFMVTNGTDRVFICLPPSESGGNRLGHVVVVTWTNDGSLIIADSTAPGSPYGTTMSLASFLSQSEVSESKGVKLIGVANLTQEQFALIKEKLDQLNTISKEHGIVHTNSGKRDGQAYGQARPATAESTSDSESRYSNNEKSSDGDTIQGDGESDGDDEDDRRKRRKPTGHQDDVSEVDENQENEENQRTQTRTGLLVLPERRARFDIAQVPQEFLDGQNVCQTSNPCPDCISEGLRRKIFCSRTSTQINPSHRNYTVVNATDHDPSTVIDRIDAIVPLNVQNGSRPDPNARVSQLARMMRAETFNGQRIYFIAGHLISQLLGGQGLDFNLAVMTQSCNQQFERQFEARIKLLIFREMNPNSNAQFRIRIDVTRFLLVRADMRENQVSPNYYYYPAGFQVHVELLNGAEREQSLFDNTMREVRGDDESVRFRPRTDGRPGWVIFFDNEHRTDATWEEESCSNETEGSSDRGAEE